MLCIANLFSRIYPKE